MYLLSKQRSSSGIIDHSRFWQYCKIPAIWFYCSQNFKLPVGWRLFHKRIVSTNFDMYVFIYICEIWNKIAILSNSVVKADQHPDKMLKWYSEQCTQKMSDTIVHSNMLFPSSRYTPGVATSNAFKCIFK